MLDHTVKARAEGAVASHTSALAARSEKIESAPHKVVRVLVVEDCPAMQQMIVYLLRSDPQIEVAGTACDGDEAVNSVVESCPDVVVVDVNMRKINGFELTRRIMETKAVPVVIVSANWQPSEVATTFKAVEAGAVAVVGKPHAPGHRDFKFEAAKLIEIVKAMSEVKVVRRWSRPRVDESRPRARLASSNVRAVAIGASTGGPAVLQTILGRLPRDFPAPVLIVQHIATGFLQGMADWLASTTSFPIQIARADDVLLPGHAYLAPDGLHMGVTNDGRILLGLEAPDAGLRPSVAHLFASVARVYGPDCAAILLTGMGKDGAAQLKLLRHRGALTIAQDQDSSVVFGMPGEAVRLGAACHVLPPEPIAALLESVVH